LTVKIFKASVKRDLRKINPNSVGRILREIRNVLADNPRIDEALHGDFAGLCKLRVGDYRVIYALIEEGVLVLRIRHRNKA